MFQQLEEGGWEVRGLCSSRIRDKLVRCDLTKESEIEKQFMEFSPDIVVHMAAERRPDVVHKKPDDSKELNVHATLSLAKACGKAGAWMIYISSDYVFDGTSPPYSVDANPHPLSEYGEQKLEGERVTLREAPSAAVIRMPLLYGQMEYYKESAVTALYHDLEKESKSADHGQKRYPLYTNDIARIIAKMLEAHCAGKHLQGIFHWQGGECLTKFDMIQLIAELENLDASAILPNTSPPPFPRPEDTHMDCSRLIQALGIDPVNFRTPIRDALRESFRLYAIDSLAAGPATSGPSEKIQQPCQPAVWSTVYKDEISLQETQEQTIEDQSNCTFLHQCIKV